MVEAGIVTTRGRFFWQRRLLLSGQVGAEKNRNATGSEEMAGFICKPEVEANRDFIVQAYGIEFYVACLEAEGETFLSLLVKHKKI